MSADPTEPGKQEQDLGNSAGPILLGPLNKVRAWLIVSGILLVLVHGLELFTARDVIIQEQKKGGAEVRPAEFERVLSYVQLNAGVGIFLGGIYIVLGITLKRFPVHITILCLVFYLLYQGVLTLFNPAVVVTNILFKVIVGFALVMAIVSAFLYQRAVPVSSDKPD